MYVDESRSNYVTARIEFSITLQPGTNLGDPTAVNSDIRGKCRPSGAIDDGASSKDKFAHDCSAPVFSFIFFLVSVLTAPLQP
jgi:hypothetical protein